MLDSLNSDRVGTNKKLEKVTLLLGVPALIIYLLGSLGIARLVLLVSLMGGILALLVLPVYFLPLLLLYKLYIKKRYLLSILVICLIYIASFFVLRTLIASEVYPFEKDHLVGALVFPEEAFPKSYKPNKYSSAQTIYIDQSRVDNTKTSRPQISYSYDETGKSCKPDEDYQQIDCFPNGMPGLCFKDKRTARYTDGDYDPPRFQIKDGLACISVSFRDDAFSPEQMIELINSMKRKEQEKWYSFISL